MAAIIRSHRPAIGLLALALSLPGAGASAAQDPFERYLPVLLPDGRETDLPTSVREFADQVPGVRRGRGPRPAAQPCVRAVCDQSGECDERETALAGGVTAVTLLAAVGWGRHRRRPSRVVRRVVLDLVSPSGAVGRRRMWLDRRVDRGIDHL